MKKKEIKKEYIQLLNGIRKLSNRYAILTSLLDSDTRRVYWKVHDDLEKLLTESGTEDF